jgi:hypothetical protein
MLSHLRRAWPAESLIHGDLKGPNIVPAGDRVLLVDWELVQWGDPAWDLGGVFQGVIVEEILGLELPERAGVSEAMESFGAVVAARRAELAFFWEAYRAARGLSPEEAGSLQERLASNTGLRLIKTAYEWCQSETRMPGRAAAILQLGINMMRQPVMATTTVLGVTG